MIEKCEHRWEDTGISQELHLPGSMTLFHYYLCLDCLEADMRRGATISYPLAESNDALIDINQTELDDAVTALTAILTTVLEAREGAGR